MRDVSDECAYTVLEVVPQVMAAIRAAMRGRRTSDLSLPQFRSLAFLNRHAGASLGEVAEHVGLTLSASSKLVDDLVERGLVERAALRHDRRFVTLALTPEGADLFATIRHAAQADLAERLSGLSSQEQAVVIEALQALQRVFSTVEVVK